MTASAQAANWQLVADPAETRVYLAPREEVWGLTAPPAELSWTRQPRIKNVVLHLTEGLAVGTAELQLTRGPADGLIAPASLLQPAQDLSTWGDTDLIAAPEGIQRWDVIKVCFCRDASGAGEVCKYVGYVADWDLDLEDDSLVLHCVDGMHVLAHRMVLGQYWFDLIEERGAWVHAALPVFNPGGKPNLYNYWDRGSQNIGFVEPECARSIGWTRGHAWNYLRYVHSAAPQKGIKGIANFFDMPEAKAGGWGAELFDDDDGIFQELHLGGKSLAQALDFLVRKRSDISWRREYDGTTGRMRPVLFGTGGESINSSQGRTSIRRGDLDQSVLVARPDVATGRIRFVGSRTVTKVLALGAPKRFDLSFSTVGGASAPLVGYELGWTAADQAAWLALDEEERAKQYPHVFRRWLVRPDVRMATLFGWVANLAHKRKAEHELNSRDVTDPTLKIRLLAWRSKSLDDEGNPRWELCPDELRPNLCHDELGIESPAGARERHAWFEDADMEVWCWNDNNETPLAYDMRITVAVEADERLYDWEGGDPTGWPQLEKLLVDEGYQYHARREAWLLCSGGVPVASGGAPALLGSGADDPIRDDTIPLESMALKMVSQQLRVFAEGRVPLIGIRADLAVGDFVEKLQGGGSTGARPDLDLSAVIRGIEYDSHEQSTLVTLGGD